MVEKKDFNHFNKMVEEKEVETLQNWGHMVRSSGRPTTSDFSTLESREKQSSAAPVH
jgi:hypothetical protein